MKELLFRPQITPLMQTILPVRAGSPEDITHRRERERESVLAGYRQQHEDVLNGNFESYYSKPDNHGTRPE